MLSFQTFHNKLQQQVHIAPLAMFRVIFGGMMFLSIIRFISKGWVYDLYVAPNYYFTFYGFDWVKPLGYYGMYALFGIMALAALFIFLGLFYRIAATIFFLSFTYVELIDKTNYLNHYYFVSIMAFLLMLAPAHKYFSLDVLRKPNLRIEQVPLWTILIFKLQLGLVYFYAGIAKLNPDWLFEAMPLRYWLPANAHLPIIGPYLDLVWVAFAFSWAGAVYDIFVPFCLANNKLRPYAYLSVVVFHILTGILFPIGMFPYIMIASTLVFFPESFHKSVISKISHTFATSKTSANSTSHVHIPIQQKAFSLQKLVLPLLYVHFVVQLIFPWRFMLYPDTLFWTEQGYRFSWRVMLMEKMGYAIFRVTDPATGRQAEVDIDQYLTPNQQKMMTTQPDMILQFAHFLKREYQKLGVSEPEVRVEAYVTMNGKGSRLFIDPTVDLTKEEDTWKHKKWILPYKKEFDYQTGL